MFSKGYLAFGSALLLLYAVAVFRGWEVGPLLAGDPGRTGRSVFFWGGGFRGGK